MIDGTRFEHDYCVILYWDIVLNKPQGLRFSTGEIGEEITRDLEYLKAKGVNCVGAVSDGGKAIILSLNAVYDDIPKQRCLVHIQRRTMGWLTQRPKLEAGVYLREICKCINKIKTKREKNKWIKTFQLWDKTYNEFLKERTVSFDGKHWRYTHRNLRRVRRHILNALPFMFLYLDCPSLPKDTNKLEGGVFSWLKDTCGRHRGITKDKRASFLTWYIHFKYLDKG
ncbi:transposase [Patescibacteria group bacterium]|nr:transposase [Patescibacteria group bacterium]